MKTPNIFTYATSELSQDAAIAYHLAWADPQYKLNYHKQHALGVDMLKLLVGNQAEDLNIGEVPIEVGLQYDHIDIWVHIGNKAVLIIEDKTNTFEHSEQIEKYRGIATKWLDPDNVEWGENRVLVTYLKTGNESIGSAPKAPYINKIDRAALLSVLNKHTAPEDQVIEQFRAYLQSWEDDTNSYQITPVEEVWTWRGVEGFYMNLESALADEGVEINKWEYVSNQTGGFLAFYWNWVWLPEFNCQLYLQIEHAKCLKIRVSDAQDSGGTPIRADASLRWKLLSRLQELARSEKYSDLRIEKSGRYKAGWTGGVAIVESYIGIRDDGSLDMRATVKNLKLIMDLLFEAAN